MKSQIDEEVLGKWHSFIRSDCRYATREWVSSLWVTMFCVIIQAGILTRQLLLALEPEAASIYCNHVPVEVMSYNKGRTGAYAFEPGTQYMVLDLGGQKLLQITQNMMGFQKLLVNTSCNWTHLLFGNHYQFNVFPFIEYDNILVILLKLQSMYTTFSHITKRVALYVVC